MSSMISKGCLFALVAFLFGCGGGSEESQPQPTSTETPSVKPQPTTPEPQPTTPEPQPITPDNQKPTVEIEGEVSGQERQALVLTANASDTDGTIVSYHWQHDAELEVSLSGTDSQKLELSTPDIQQDVAITFTVTVTDDRGAKETATHTVIFERNEIAVQLQGMVTDQPIPNATVTATIGNETFTAIANAQGEYTLDIAADESSKAALVQLHAQGVGDQSRVEFISQLPSIDEIVIKSGADKVLLATELFGVNVTNVTTAEYAQLSKHEGAFDSLAQLQDTLLLVDTAEKMKLATLIKAIVDNDIDLLPTKFSSTLALVSDKSGAEQLYSELEVTHPELLKKASEGLLEDATLLPGLASELIGDYTLSIPNKMHGLLVNLTFNEDGTGTITAGESASFNWEKNAQVVTLSFAEPVVIVPPGVQTDFGASAKTVLNHLSLTMIEERNGVIEAYVSYEHGLIFDLMPTPLKNSTEAFANLLKTTPDISINEEALVGEWYVQHHMLEYSFGETLKLEFFADGTASQGSGEITWQWHLTETELVLENTDKRVAYQILDHTSGKFNTKVFGHLKESDSILNGAVFVKQQASGFDSFDFIGSWTSTNSQYDSRQFFFFEDNTYLTQLGYSSVWALEQGQIELGEFQWNGHKVSHCETTQSSCQFNSAGVFEFVGVFGNDIAVRYTKPNIYSPTVPKSQSYLKFFTIHSEDGQQLLNTLMPYSQTSTLYGLDDTLKFEMQCPSGPCYAVAEYKGVAYRVEDKGTYMVLSNDDTNEQLVLFAEVVSSTELEVCIRSVSGQCDESNTATFSTLGPELDFTVTVEGQGTLIAHTDKPRLGEVLSLTVEPSNGYIVSEISGCNGYFYDQSMTFEVYRPPMSCHITAKFIKGNDFIGQLRLLRKGFYAPEHFDIDIRASGEGLVSHGALYSNFTWQAAEGGGITAQLTQPQTVSLDKVTASSDDFIEVVITGFDLNKHAEGIEVVWHRQLNNQGEIHLVDSLVDVLDDRRDFAEISLTQTQFLGTWSLGYGAAEHFYFTKHMSKDAYLPWLDTYQLVLKENGEGEIQSGEKVTSISWSWHGNYIEIIEMGDYSNIIHVSLLKELDGSYQFSARYESGPYMSALQKGAGIMVKHQTTAPIIENSPSVWRIKNGSELAGLEGMEVYGNGIVRMGTAITYSHAYFDDNKLYLQDFWNSETHQTDASCTNEKPECVERAYRRLMPLAQGEKTLFTLDTYKINDGLSETSMLRVIERSSGESFTKFEPFMLSQFKLYQTIGENKHMWSTWYVNGVYKMDTSFGQGDAQLDEAGRIKYHIQDEYYYVQLLEASSDGLKVCYYAESDSCSEANEIFLSYQ
ncbi:carboxypeptidase regulatory-like domain-containing protein [Pseudoalteromonas luteoviolacea]|nr:carboxypeptidase-like regulatory domain-containing protein [Pseudoalteromonas luteoviolacea]MBQ4835489.1 carboxypeptidase regulatory-like domain-containing protein [Pseudoalteromonas luteoviolacea]